MKNLCKHTRTNKKDKSPFKHWNIYKLPVCDCKIQWATRQTNKKKTDHFAEMPPKTLDLRHSNLTVSINDGDQKVHGLLR